jgi:lipid-binding SYLF domain-containing protein
MVLSIVLMGILFSNSLSAKTAREIDVEVEVAIERFHGQVIGAKQLINASKGMLVMPNVFKGAFLLGGEYGEGALRIDGKTVDYYNTASGSIGLQIGGQKKDIILLFIYGAGVREDTTTTKEPIIGFVYDSKGLIADFSFKGAKFTKMDPDK